MSEAWIIDALRTPRGIGKIGKGAMANVHPQRMLSTCLRALADRNGLRTEDVDDVIAGCGMQYGKQGGCIARMAALDAGWSNEAVGFSVERFCGSSLTAVHLAVMGVASGMQNLVIAGGVESMSHAGTLDGHSFIDSGNLHLRSLHPQPHQGICADLIATLEGISRDDVDKLAVESQRRANRAIKEGYFGKSIIAVYQDDGTLALDRDELARPATTLEALEKLKPSFEAFYERVLDEYDTSYASLVRRRFPQVDIRHIHHAGNSSGIADGAAALMVASPHYAKAHGLRPRAKVRVVTTVGDDPSLMLNAPVPAAKKALALAGMNTSDLDLIEINEAFAVVPLKFMRDLQIDPTRVNVNGGAIALGHPIGATGAMILGTLLDELERRDMNIGMATMCTGGGMAPATIIERI